VKYQDISPHNAQGNPTSKLYPATRPIKLKRISSPRKPTKKEISQKASQRNQQLTLTLTMKKRIFPKATRNHT